MTTTLVVGCRTSEGPISPTTSRTTGPTTSRTTGPKTGSEGPAKGKAPLVSDTCSEVPEYGLPDPERPRYRLAIEIKPEQGVVEGRQHVRFVPDQVVDRLVFRLWANGPRPTAAGAHLEVTGTQVDGRIAELQGPTSDPTTLVIPLEGSVRAGKAIEVDMTWHLTLPGPSRDRLARQGDAMRLGSFFPLLAWEPGVGWALEPPTTRLAEAGTSPVADFTLEVTHPDDLTVLASGVHEGGDRWRAEAMRDIALSIGRFRVATAVAHVPEPATITVGVHEGLDDDPNRYLQRIVSAIEDFSRRYGAYPYTTYTVALTPGLTGGIEYPGFAMQGPETYGRSTPHEVAHQWFYALVGNNQGRDPWLDEGPATWAEARFEGTLPAFVGKVIPPEAVGQTTRPMSWWDGHGDAYYRGVYVQPAQAFAALGDPEAVDCALRRYVATNAFKIARPDDLSVALESVSPGAGATLAAFGIGAR
ncbi:MAG: hypothetical protein WA797_08130 [Acidimicrobiales bacterium]